jgi:uncharacterized FAD-dependent dehydrogenase
MKTLYIPELRLHLDEPVDVLRQRAAEALHATPGQILRLEVRRRSLDTRQQTVWSVFGVEVDVDEARLDPRDVAHYAAMPKRAAPIPPAPRPRRMPANPVVVVGAGPAGLFCALRLREAGLPVVILERGKPIRERAQDTKLFRKGGMLNPESNIQFGEGGAGTYSDGKLTYRTDDPLAAYVLDGFIRYGAKPDIRVLSRPHIGTEHLRACIVRMTKSLQDAGLVFHYGGRVEGLVVERAGDLKRARGVRLASGEELAADQVVLAIGHSARDTFLHLAAQGVPFVPKAFSVGVRAEHPQDLIDRTQYGRHAGNRALPAASYALSQTVDAHGERGVYSFCMCPGGEVMACSSEAGGVVTNGMSFSVQRSGYADSGIVVAVNPADVGATETDPFAGMRFQRELEAAAFALGGGGYRAPAQRIGDFLRRRTSGALAPLGTTYRPGVTEADLTSVLPPFVAQAIAKALPAFDKKIAGYATNAGVFVGFETRTSSPVRIPRGESLWALGWERLYPLGEGAGYAGGILSAAVDGVRAADAILAQYA